ncbi:hypothetical protein ABZP36_017050 [Zizania latifolia]
MAMLPVTPMPCGNVSISYPFYFSTETKDLNGYSTSYCGYPGLAIECDDGKPMLPLDGPDKYLVKNISYGNDSYGSVSLADPMVLEDRSRCPKVDHNVTIPLSSWLYFPGMSVDYLVFFLDCSFTAPIVQPPAIYQYQLTCGNLELDRLSFFRRTKCLTITDTTGTCRRRAVKSSKCLSSVIQTIQEILHGGTVSMARFFVRDSSWHGTRAGGRPIVSSASSPTDGAVITKMGNSSAACA